MGTLPSTTNPEKCSRRHPTPARGRSGVLGVRRDAGLAVVDDLARVQVAAGVDALEELALDEHASRRDVLVHPGAVLLADTVVVRDGAVEVQERLLDDPLRSVVGRLRVVGVVGDGEGEVLAGARMVGVAEVAEDDARPRASSPEKWLYSWMCGSWAAWEAGFGACEVQHREGDEGFGSVEAERDSGDQSDLGVD